MNARSILRKMDVVRSVVENAGVHVLMVSETWLSSDVSDAMVRLPGFKIYRNDRDNWRWSCNLY